MAHLRLSLLGAFCITLDGQPVTGFGYDKVRALLAYLAVEVDRPQRRETLAGLLWPEQPERNARQNLSQALFRLRKAIGDARADPPFLVIAPESIQFNANSDHWLDVFAFTAGVGAHSSHDHRRLETCTPCLERMEAALQLHAGGFLEGLSIPDSPAFEEWIVVQRERLHRLALQTLASLAHVYELRGEYQRALPFAWREVELEPWRESAHRQLMRLLALNGRQDAALAQYETCRRLLADELGLVPSGEMTRLHEQIRDGQLRVAISDWREPTVALPSFLARDAKPAIKPPVFVARQGQLARLDEFLKNALAGQGQIVFVTGGPGRGKTALMRAFAWRAIEIHQDLLVGMGSGNAYSGAGDPYLPFREVMNILTGDAEALWSAGAISREGARRLWMALPIATQAMVAHGPQLIDVFVSGAALASRAALAAPDGAPWHEELVAFLEHRIPRPPALKQRMIFQQFADVLLALAQKNPLLLILDDLQWIDKASAGLLFHLGRRLADFGGRIMILSAYRPEEVSGRLGESRHPLEQVLAEFRRRFGDVWFDLTRIDEVDGRLFINAYLDSEPNRLGEEFRHALNQRTGGHPLFTVELLRTLQERGELIHDAQGAWVEGGRLNWVRLPARVEAVIQGRVEGLDEQLRNLLAVASVEGGRFTAQVLAQVEGLPEREVLHALSQELGARHRLVREVGEQLVNESFLSQYQFGHALFQNYLYQSLSVGEQRLLHREVARALEELYEDQVDLIAAALAYHYYAGGQQNKAAEYALRAGDLARIVYAYGEAADHFHRALELYYEAGDRSGEASVLGRLGAVHFDWSELPEAKMYRLEALRIYRELGDQKGEAVTLNGLGWLCVFAGDYERAEHYLLEAVQIWREIDELHGLVNTMGGLGRFHREHTGDFERSRAYGQETLRLSLEIGNRFNEAIGNYVIGFANHYQGDYRAADPFLKEAVRLFGENRRLLELAVCLIGVGLNAISTGDYARAQAHLDRSRDTFGEIHMQNVDDDAFAQSALALLHHQLGDDQTARDYAARALAIHRETGYAYRTATALTRLGHALTALGELTEAGAAYQQALDLRREMGQRHLAPEPLAGLARVALDRDDPTAALAHVEAVLSHLEIGSPSASSGCKVDGTDEPLRIYLTCYRVLSANGDPRAEEVLESAHRLLQERSAKIEDEALQRSYLENVRANREILREWQAVGRRS